MFNIKEVALHRLSYCMLCPGEEWVGISISQTNVYDVIRSQASKYFENLEKKNWTRLPQCQSPY